MLLAGDVQVSELKQEEDLSCITVYVIDGHQSPSGVRDVWKARWGVVLRGTL